MNKQNEAIALELTRIYIENARNRIISEKRVIEIYQKNLEILNGEAKISCELEDLEYENNSLKYKLKMLKDLCDKDENNFILKDALLKIIGGE